MACYHPISAFHNAKLSQIAFRQADGCKDGFKPIKLPCGQCVGCRLKRSRDWAFRCTSEASQYDDNCFLTLTYDNEHLPDDGSVHVEHFQLFMKRLRKRFPDRRIRFFHCGEYGEDFGRPHYHALLFNFDFPDKIFFSIVGGNRLFTSELLSEIWGMGHCLIGAVTFESAAYVARYVMKKVTGDNADEHYVDKDTGVLRNPEYITMSRGGRGKLGGIGTAWYKRFKSDVFPSDEVIVKGKAVRPPRFYDAMLKVEDPVLYEKLKKVRIAKSLKYVPVKLDDGRTILVDDNDGFRLLVKEEVKLASIRTLKRPLETN